MSGFSRKFLVLILLHEIREPSTYVNEYLELYKNWFLFLQVFLKKEKKVSLNTNDQLGTQKIHESSDQVLWF